MSKYYQSRTSYRDLMFRCLTQSPSEVPAFAAETAMPTFKHIINGQTTDYDAWIKWIQETIPDIAEYEPVIDEFNRDGNKFTASWSGTALYKGEKVRFASKHEGEVDAETGKQVWMKEDVTFEPVGGKGEGTA